MKDTIQNNILNFSVRRLGAELYSLRTLKGVEYIWRADTEIWARHAPILFPVIGKLKDNKYRYGNKWYHMNQHGFARDENFEFKEKTQDSLKYCLQANDRTLKSYPFEFGLSVIYKLTDNILNTDFYSFCQKKRKNLLSANFYSFRQEKRNTLLSAIILNF